MSTTKSEILKEVGRAAGAVGRGLLAGLAGTVAITASQMIEMAIQKREQSKMPADVASKVLGVEPINEKEKSKFAQEVHWAYGTSWGAIRGLLSESGIKGWAASATHFVLIWGTGMMVEDKLGDEPAVDKWDAKTIAIEGLHHAVYALATGLVYDAIDQEED